MTPTKTNSTTTNLTTRGGSMRLEWHRPSSSAGAPWPAVVFCFDGPGMREAMSTMAQALADEGFVVVIPDFFHRGGDVLDVLPADVPRATSSIWGQFRNAAFRTAWRDRFFGPATNADNLRDDLAAVFAALDADKDVKAGGVGTTGYCMGGHISLKLAGLFPERVKAAASFHGGGLATDAPDSPHLLAPQMKARLYVAGATDDSTFDDASKARLVAALGDARREFVVETYAAAHGFAVPDCPVWNAAAAARHHDALVKLMRSL